MESPQHQSPPWGRSTKTIVAVGVLLLCVLVLWRFRSLLSPVIIAVILAYLLNPSINFVQQQVNLRRGAAVLLVYLILLAVVAGVGFMVGISTWEQGTELYLRLPSLLDQALARTEEQVDRLFTQVIVVPAVGPYGPYPLDPARLFAGLDGAELVNQGYDLLRPFFSRGGSLAAQIAGATLRTVSLFFFVLVLSIYVARDMKRFGQLIGDIAHQPGYREDADRLLDDFSRIWDAYLRGQVVLALVIGTVVSIILGLLGVRNALALGILSGLLEFLPIVGPVIGAGAAILVALFQPNNYLGLSPAIYALLIAGVMIGIQQLENSILVPRIVGNALKLHPLAIMISVLMGASLAGILGAILAAPVLATVKLLGGYAWLKMFDLPPFPEEREAAAQGIEQAKPRALDRLHGWLTGFREETTPKDKDET